MNRAFCQEPNYPPPNFNKELVQGLTLEQCRGSLHSSNLQVQVKKMPHPKFIEVSLKGSDEEAASYSAPSALNDFLQQPEG